MEIPRHWRLKAQRYNLAGIVCDNCNEKIFPPRPICPKCHGETIIHPNRKSEVIFDSKTISLPQEASMSSK